MVSGKVLLEKPPSYQIVNLQIPDIDLRTFSKHLFDGDDVEVVESDAETEEFPATVSDAGMHLSDRFAMHEKYGFPEALLTFRGLWEAKDNTKNNLDESWTRSKSNTSTFSQGTFQ